MDRGRRGVVALAAILLVVASGATSRAQTRPVIPSQVMESVAGKDNFERYCAPCHGQAGRGDGPVATGLKTRPTDLTSLARRNGGVFPRERVVSFVTGTGREVEAHRSGEMPVWGSVFRGLDPSDARVKQRITNVVTYIESLQASSTAEVVKARIDAIVRHLEGIQQRAADLGPGAVIGRALAVSGYRFPTRLRHSRCSPARVPGRDIA